MAKDKIFLKDEVEANKGMAWGCLIAAILLTILWICYVTHIFPMRSRAFVEISFPFNILLLCTPVIFIKTKYIEKPGFKYFVLILFSFVIALVNVAIPKHGILGWGALIVLTSHYRSPKMLGFMTTVTLVLMAICLGFGMLIGEWDSNLMGVSDLDFHNYILNGHEANPDVLEDRFYWLNHYVEYRPESSNRWLSAFGFYYGGRAASLLLISFISIQLCNRNKKLLINEASAINEKGKIDADLNIACQIQQQALPREFPEVDEFDVFALMQAAKEVGGDFYDLYKTGATQLAFTVADVSGKGVPAALFMMKSKTLMKTLSLAGQTPEKVVEHSNFELCEGNDQGMFVTSLHNVLDLKNGILKMVNAGHNPPLLRHFGGEFEYLKLPKGFVMGGFDSSKYKAFEQKLEPGDSLFLYTDGVTEAMNENGELYGEERLQKFLNTLPADKSAKECCGLILEDVKNFAGTAPQADDITMFMLTYVGPKAHEITVEGTRENVDVVTEFVRTKLQDKEVDRKTIAQINVAVDEIYSNIAQYAYEGKIGPISVQVRFFEEFLAISFIDQGIPFNPLERDDPDVTLDAEERGIGGLGIFIVKQTMDKVVYNYISGSNTLTIAKIINK